MTRHVEKIAEKRGVARPQRRWAGARRWRGREPAVHFWKIRERVEPVTDSRVVVFVAYGVEALGDRARVCRFRHRSRGFGSAKEHRDDIAHGVFLRADLLIHERRKSREQSGVHRAQTTAHRRTLERLSSRLDVVPKHALH
ncbi:MAG TPA: hypothetical protein VKD22_18085, partial [Ramlibacter sp.]|nr:hypothetical protein [Ramlibacter sp.]